MFETVAVESRAQPIRRGRLATLPVSVALHALALSAAVLSSVWDVTLPKNAPAQFQAFGGVRPTPALPVEQPVRAEPPKSEGPKSQTIFSQPVPTNPTTQTPRSIPDQIPDVTAGEQGPPEIAVGGPGSPTVGEPAGGGDQVGPVEVGPGMAMMPKVLRRVQPEYPRLLISAGLRGSAVVECVVGRDGVITSATVVTATHQLFGESARVAVMQWRFLPGRLNGEPVATIFRLTVNFDVKR